MKHALLISAAEKGLELLYQVLEANGFSSVVFVRSTGEARRAMIDQSFDLVVINTPLREEFGQDLAQSIAENTFSGIVLLVKAELAQSVSETAEESGVLVLPKPISRQLLYQGIHLAVASQKRMLQLESENDRLQKKLAEIKLVDRAKCALIQYRQMTENEAHRYVEKTAMDRRISRSQAAQDILSYYEGA